MKTEVKEQLEISEWLVSQKLTAEDMDFMWDFCVVFNHQTIKGLDAAGIDWKMLSPRLVKEVPVEYEKIVKKVLYESED